MMLRLAVLVTPVAALLSGCTGPDVLLEGPVYPVGVEQRRVVDVQVVREETWLVFTNTTPRDIGAGRVWVNQEFALPFDGLEVGETARLPLGAFENEFGERFRAGGFFAIRPPTDVVLVQVEEDDARGLLGLVVVDGEAE